MTNTSAARPVLNGRYELHRRIARGGMADVFLAKDQLLDRPVAVKVLFPQYASEPTFVARFRREAQAAANLNHPSIVSVYDWGEHEDTYFIVMEYVEGRTLAELIAGEGHLHPDRAAEIATDVAAALGFAHRNGTVHRDVKPGNIMINQAGQVKVADFGIARAFGGNDDELTQTGSVMGTASYFSPEQAQGKPVDPRSDLYSLGIVLFEMVVGEPPFTGNSPVAIAYKHVQEMPPRSTSRNPAVPAPLDAIIDRLLRKDAGERYPAAEEVRADLRRFREGQPLVGVGPQQAAAEANNTMVVPNAPSPVDSVDSTIAMPVGPATAAMPTRGPDTGSSRAIIDTSRAVPASTAVRQDEPVEEYYEPPSRTGVFVIMLAVLLAALVGLIFYISNTIEPNADEDDAIGVELVQVPTVLNERVESAENDLRDAGFEVVTQLVDNPDVADNIVFDQDPDGQQEAELGSTVTILVSKAADTERVPVLTGQPLESAQAALAELGLKNDIEREAHEEIAEGLIIRTDPPEGEEVNVGTQILLIVSLGPDQVEIPELAGSSKEDATRLMQEAGFANFIFEDEGTSRIPAGEVIRTEPPAGQKESIDNAVKVFVSRGPDQVQVPQLAQNSREAAETALAELELAPNFVDQPLAADDPRVGQVVNTNPGPGSVVQQGSTIEVRIGVAQQDTVPPETTVPNEETTVPPENEENEGNDDT